MYIYIYIYTNLYCSTRFCTTPGENLGGRGGGLRDPRGDARGAAGGPPQGGVGPPEGRAPAFPPAEQRVYNYHHHHRHHRPEGWCIQAFAPILVCLRSQRSLPGGGGAKIALFAKEEPARSQASLWIPDPEHQGRPQEKRRGPGLREVHRSMMCFCFYETSRSPNLEADVGKVFRTSRAWSSLPSLDK